MSDIAEELRRDPHWRVRWKAADLIEALMPCYEELNAWGLENGDDAKAAVRRVKELLAREDNCEHEWLDWNDGVDTPVETKCRKCGIAKGSGE